MKVLGFVLASVVLAAGTASAQVASTAPTPLSMPSPPVFLASSSVPSPDALALATPAPALAAEPALAADPSVAADPAAAPAEPKANAQGPTIGVFQNYNFQLYLGLALTRFYEAPHLIQTREGFDSSLTYYYRGGWVGADGEFMATFGSQFNENSRFLFAGGGPRFRWAGERHVEFWGHALVGGSHYTPQTAFGGQGAFAYELGLGVDALAHHQRLAYRIDVDMLGTRYFNTYQYSPKASVGIVYKF
jgi:hypothetical protein